MSWKTKNALKELLSLSFTHNNNEGSAENFLQDYLLEAQKPKFWEKTHPKYV